LIVRAEGSRDGSYIVKDIVLKKNYMRNIKLTIEYDGTNYVGWQVQPNGLSIQQVLEEAFAKILKESVRLSSSGRTDAGVHARGMVAAFRTDKEIPLRAFSEGVNSILPPDIVVHEAVEMPLEFHPRIDALGKHYRYTILNAKLRSPLKRSIAWHIRNELDLEAMREAALYFLGEKDFAAFRAANCCAKTTVRRIDSMEITRDCEFVTIDVIGNGFLRNMVRVIAGTLVEVGRRVISPDDIPGLIEGCDRRKSGVTAPPQGLCLMEVYY
jgi:tRNA pseudouridine38-40 synthase